jgi:hypothetical protein
LLLIVRKSEKKKERKTEKEKGQIIKYDSLTIFIITILTGSYLLC